jgi:ATP-dependent Lhr-like helicase
VTATGLDRLHPGVVHHIVNTLGWPSLRPLQSAAIGPLLDGSDALLLAPTAGGKTEAAVFPLLSAMAAEGWRGLSVLYVCPLKALLNNLQPRIGGYAAWIGRTAALWHGDTTASQRRRLRAERPDILLTTPESIESLLVSPLVNPREFFADLRAVVVDEVHAFAGDDRGWHMLAVLARLERLAGRPLQRIGLSATVGNPDQLLHWLQGSGAGGRPATVVNPANGPPASGSPAGGPTAGGPTATSPTAGGPPATGAVTPAPPEVGLDYVGSIANAATVIGTLHRGEKRLVFCESRSQVEQLALALRTHGVTTFVSHSSLSVDERRQAEQAFAEARDCVIVATSTLELGIDVGDLDRVIQIDAPRTVASFLQRLGRTGRRPGTRRNTLFLATSSTAFLRAAGLLHLWAEGYVEPIVPPPSPRHIAAQQILALCLQEGRVGANVWRESWGNLAVFDHTADEILAWLIHSGHLESDGDMLFIGPEAERRFGRRNFMDLLAVFAAAPQFTVLHGRQEVGSADPLMLMRKTEGPRVLSLGGRPWRVTYIDWPRRRCYVEPTDLPGRSLWQGILPPESYELSQAQRAVLLGATPPVDLSKRAQSALTKLREQWTHRVWDAGTVVERRDDEVRWWTFAGDRANATLAAALGSLVDDSRPDGLCLRLRPDVDGTTLRAALSALAPADLPPPVIDDSAVHGLKFAEILPPALATDTLARRLIDEPAARETIRAPFRLHALARSSGNDTTEGVSA